MNNKGFTLIELIGVVLILIILITYATPRIAKFYKNSKKSTFLNNVAMVYSKSQEKRTENKIFDKPTNYIYSEDNTCLDLTGKRLYYCVLFENEKVTYLNVFDGKYYIEATDNFDKLKISQVKENESYKLECAAANQVK